MAISKDDAQQFLDALNDYLSNGDIEIDAIEPHNAGLLSRKEMNIFLFELFEATLALKETN